MYSTKPGGIAHTYIAQKKIEIPAKKAEHTVK
ncbi:PTS fructose transporter subunit IIB, partial [Klebsiella pneumoniae]